MGLTLAGVPANFFKDNNSMNARKRRLAKRRRAAASIHVGRNRLWKHYLLKGWTCFVDQLSDNAPEAYARSNWGYQVRLW